MKNIKQLAAIKSDMCVTYCRVWNERIFLLLKIGCSQPKTCIHTWWKRGSSKITVPITFLFKSKDVHMSVLYIRKNTQPWTKSKVLNQGSTSSRWKIIIITHISWSYENFRLEAMIKIESSSISVIESFLLFGKEETKEIQGASFSCMHVWVTDRRQGDILG